MFESMFVVAIVGQKGGTGKTTAGIGLAVAAANAVKFAQRYVKSHRKALYYQANAMRFN